MNKNKVTKFLSHVFIAGKHNSYKPHLSRYYGLAVFFIIIFSLSLAMNLLRPSVKGVKSDLNRISILQAINAARASKGIGELTIDNNLNIAAEKKATDIFEKQYWDHKSPSGKTPWAFISESGYDYTLAAENLAKDYTSAEEVTAAWLGSIKHRENLLSSNYRDLGVGIEFGKLLGRDTLVIVTMYGTKKGEEVAGAASGNLVSKYSSYFLDNIGFYSNPISPMLLIILAFIGLYAVITAFTHLKIKSSQGIKDKDKLKMANANKLLLLIIIVTLLNVFLAFYLPKV